MPTAFSQAAGLAIRAMLADQGVEAALKWPTTWSSAIAKSVAFSTELAAGADACVLGIGINVNLTECDLSAAGIADRATSLRLHAGRPFDCNCLLKDIALQLERFLPGCRRCAVASIMTDWMQHDALADRCITIQTAKGEHISGAYLGLSDDGALRLRDTSGS